MIGHTMKTTNFYNTLGVRPDATQKEIKKAFRRLVKIYHPDVRKTPDAEERMKDINAAYEVLSDPEKRQRFDMDSKFAEPSPAPKETPKQYNKQPRSDPPRKEQPRYEQPRSDPPRYEKPRYEQPRNPVKPRRQMQYAAGFFVFILILVFMWGGIPQTAADEPRGASPIITISPVSSMDTHSNSVFLPDGVIIENNLPIGRSENYYFNVGNPNNIRFIRIKVEGKSDFDFILGKDYVPTFIPRRYDRIAEMGLQTEEMDIYNLEQGTYFLTVKNRGDSQAGFTIVKSIFYK